MGRYDLYQRRKPVGTTVFLLIVLLITAAGAWFYWHSTQTVEPEVGKVTRELTLPKQQKRNALPKSDLSEANETLTNNQQEPIEEKTQAAPLPVLNESDGFIDAQLTELSPELAAWLKTDDQIRKVVLIINDFSQGQRLYKHLRWLKLNGPFIAEEDRQGLYLSSKSYQRYNSLAEAVDSVNVEAILALYRRVRPLCEEVFAGFGYPDNYRLEDLIKKAAAEILSAPVIEKRIALEKPKVLYRFADEHLESLNPVQKQMLRMGPQNTRIIQNKLRLLIEAFVDMNETNSEVLD